MFQKATSYNASQATSYIHFSWLLVEAFTSQIITWSTMLYSWLQRHKCSRCIFVFPHFAMQLLAHDRLIWTCNESIICDLITEVYSNCDLIAATVTSLLRYAAICQAFSWPPPSLITKVHHVWSQVILMCVITSLFLQQELNSLRTLHASLLALKEMVKAVNKVCSSDMQDKMTTSDALYVMETKLLWHCQLFFI